MNNADLTLQTGILLSVTKHAQLMKEIVAAEPEKGMSISIAELKLLQKQILKDVKTLNAHLLEEKFLVEQAKKELDLISQIVKRGFSVMRECYVSTIDMFMDIEYAHRDCPLNLQKWLDADGANFFHDAYGIHKNLNRKTKKLDNCFVPRYAKQDNEPDLIEDDRAYNQDLIQRANDEDML